MCFFHVFGMSFWKRCVSPDFRSCGGRLQHLHHGGRNPGVLWDQSQQRCDLPTHAGPDPTDLWPLGVGWNKGCSWNGMCICCMYIACMHMLIIWCVLVCMLCNVCGMLVCVCGLPSKKDIEYWVYFLLGSGCCNSNTLQDSKGCQSTAEIPDHRWWKVICKFVQVSFEMPLIWPLRISANDTFFWLRFPEKRKANLRVFFV